MLLMPDQPSHEATADRGRDEDPLVLRRATGRYGRGPE